MFRKACYIPKVQIIKSTISGPNVLLIGGVHGNEPAGSLALENHFNNDKLPLKGTVTLIPRANPCGLKNNIRWMPSLFDMDLNRSFNKRNKTIDFIKQFVKQADIVIDFHEGYDYHSRNPQSVGSTLSTSSEMDIAIPIVNLLNKNITDHNKKWVARNKKDPVGGTLREYCDSINKPYILVETTGQDNIQPLTLRINQCNTVISSIIHRFNNGYARKYGRHY